MPFLRTFAVISVLTSLLINFSLDASAEQTIGVVKTVTDLLAKQPDYISKVFCPAPICPLKSARIGPYAVSYPGNSPRIRTSIFTARRV
jgi:hypothetical protein